MCVHVACSECSVARVMAREMARMMDDGAGDGAGDGAWAGGHARGVYPGARAACGVRLNKAKVEVASSYRN